jgi:Tfp pilus assembly protein PilZ
MAKSNRRNWYLDPLDGRSCSRKRFHEILPTAACKTEDSAFIAPICDISSDGLFIKTSRQFSVGQEVAMTITFPATGESRMVTGEIVRISPQGVGINFKVFFKD